MCPPPFSDVIIQKTLTRTPFPRSSSLFITLTPHLLPQNPFKLSKTHNRKHTLPMNFSVFTTWVVICLVIGGDFQVGFASFARNYNYITWDDLKVADRSGDQHGGSELRLELGVERNLSRVIVVDKNGNGDSVTVQGAVNMVPLYNDQRVKIYILPGIYREKVLVPASKPYISFIGQPDEASETVITWNNKASDLGMDGCELGTYRTASVAIESDYFCATSITVENTVVAEPGEYKKQAVALRVAGDKAMFYGVRILGTQDTLLDEQGSHYYYQSYIQGSIDFIFGNARSLFKDCVLKSVAEQYGAIAAHHRETPNEETGFSFLNCTITGTGSSVFLGRAWGNYSRIIYSYCNIDGIIDPSGWNDWEDINRQKTAVFGEWQCRGKGADRRNRVRWIKSLNYYDVRPFLDTKFIVSEQWLKL